jgi:hypothetical protein
MGRKKVLPEPIQQEEVYIDASTVSQNDIARILRTVRVETGVANPGDEAAYMIEQLQEIERKKAFDEMVKVQREVPTITDKNVQNHAFIAYAEKEVGIFDKSTTYEKIANGVRWKNDEDINAKGKSLRAHVHNALEGKNLDDKIFDLIEILIKPANFTNAKRIDELIKKLENCKKKS